MSRGFARMLVAAAFVTLVVPAHAMADVSLSENGSLTYTWQGDPARGCAAAGVCGVEGALTLQLEGGISSASSGGGINVGLLTSAATVRVSGPGGDCVDVPRGPFGGQLSITSRAHAGLVARISPPFSSGRCAGPRQQDLGRLTLPVRRLGGKQPSFDLETTRSFVAGPFTGELISTVALRHAPGGGSSSSSGTFSTGPPRAPTHKGFLERVELRYRVASVPSALEATFAGESDPFCAALDSCGTSGTLALSVRRYRQTIVVTASREVPRRLSGPEVVADLRAGRLSVDSAGPVPFVAPSVPTSATETFAAPNGSRCQAATTTRQAQLFFGPGSFIGPGAARHARGHPAVGVTLTDPFAASLIRTFCPGPLDTDVFGANQSVGVARIAFAQLLRRRSIFSLSRAGSFEGTGYTGARSGGIEFSMTLERVKAATVQTSLPGRAS